MTGVDEFEAFVRAYQDMVFALASRLLGNEAEAEDVTQQVFLKAFQRFSTLGPGGAAVAWLKTVTRNACLNHLTRYRRRWRLFSEMDAPGQDGSFEAGLPAPVPATGGAERSDEHAQLERALRALPDHQRVPLVLFHFEQTGYQEIAEALGVSLAKVKTDIHRGREALKRYLVQEHATRRS
jgi:RNA polymerase sigma-70 factor (ECF subfamily)